MDAGRVDGDTFDRSALQRRTLRVLFASAISGRAAMSLGFTVAALSIKDMLDSARLAGLSTVAITVGTAVSATALSSYMGRHGRNPGLSVGYGVATAGGVLAAIGVAGQQIWVFLAGLVLFGVGQGATNLARYAAADLADDRHQGRAISTVVFASTVGAVAGPAFVGPVGAISEWAGYDELVGPFAASAVFFLVAGLIVWIALRPDPLRVAGGLRPDTSESRAIGFAEAIGLAWSRPMARLALGTLVISQAVMVMVMAMTPLHMEAHGHGTDAIGFVISAHTAGMFAFAPLAGWASDRWGRVPAIGVGAAILTGSTVITAFAGEAPHILMFPGLYLLGLGWSFGMVAGSALLNESVPDDDRVAVQGAADLATAVASGAGALASGFVFDMAGFHILSSIGTVAAGLLLVAGFTRYRTNQAVLSPADPRSRSRSTA